MNRSQILSIPDKKKIANTKVDKAIAVSETIIKNFLLYLSAQTPANNEINTWGRNPLRVDKVIISPDPVVKVICQIIAYCTIEEPNSDIDWLNKNNIEFFFQLVVSVEISVETILSFSKVLPPFFTVIGKYFTKKTFVCQWISWHKQKKVR